jgi:hypothetical protein
MKRNSLTTALLAGLAGAAGLASSAHALNLNADGIGQVLLFPYYTVNKGNQTLVSVVNTTNRVKAVKVRFLEGRNSKEVLDFNLYLSPFDVWTGAVFAGGATGPASLTTSDTSCTVPRITGPVPFRNFQYTGTNQDWSSSGTPASLAALLGAIERTREGHLEMIEMGLLRTGTGSTQLAEEATHNATGVPNNCQALVNAWLPPSGGWVVNRQADIDTPAGGLYGAGTIVDVANGTLHAYNADALEGFYTNAAEPGFLHANPGTIDPDLGDADNGTGTINVNIFTGNGTLTQYTVPARAKTRTTTLPYSYDAVSLVYMHDAIYNEYVTEAAVGASSEWVITYPTKEAYVDVLSNTLVRAPFTDAFRDNGSACEEVTIEYWNREEQVPGSVPGSVDFSPPPPAGNPTSPAFCYEAQVVAFNQSQVGAGQPSSIFGSTYASNINTRTVSGATFTTGWTKITFDDSLTGAIDNAMIPSATNGIVNVTAAGVGLAGLPVAGFWSANYVNNNVTPGTLANYSGAFKHRASRANVVP